MLSRLIKHATKLINHVPPHHFWLIWAQYCAYGLKQATRAATFYRHDARLALKHAHGIEKVMVCQLPRTESSDRAFQNVTAYLESEQGHQDPSYTYLRKLAREYRDYPHNFSCPLHKIAHRKPDLQDVVALRRTIVQRRSIRHFQASPVADHLLQQVVEAGHYAPTSCNNQQVSFITTHEKEHIDTIVGAAEGGTDWRGIVPNLIVVITDRRAYDPFAQQQVMAQDVAAATQNMLLMAHALGLAACWVTLVSDMHMRNQEQVYACLQLPAYFFIGALIAIGYPASAVCHVPRSPLHTVWFRDQFQVPAPIQSRNARDDLPFYEPQPREREVGA